MGNGKKGLELRLKYSTIVLRIEKGDGEMQAGQILIECPNTIFKIYVKSEHELTKLEIFMGNIKTVKHLGLNDIYNWCNRQGISYDTKFNYHKDFPIWKNAKSYFRYSTQKMKYQIGFSFV